MSRPVIPSLPWSLSTCKGDPAVHYLKDAAGAVVAKLYVYRRAAEVILAAINAAGDNAATPGGAS